MTNKEHFIHLFKKFITRPGSDNLFQWLESTDFFNAPASTKFHGDYEGGLCEHSIHVWEELVRLLKEYPEIKVNSETAAIVTLLHDVCKIGCYKVEMRNKKENGNWIQVPTYI